MAALEDVHGREFKKLRISLINSCNLGCVYCTTGSEDAALQPPAKSVYPVDQLLSKVAQLHQQLNLKAIRLTGGEPLLYHDLIPIIEGIDKLGVEEISITTNGFLLSRMAAQLSDAGLKSANISLDAIDEDMFFKISKRKGVHKVLSGIEEAIQHGIKVKINSVIMNGLNDNQIFPLLDYAFERGLPIRFLEVMAMGHLHHKAQDYLYKQDDLLRLIASRYDFVKLSRNTSSTANYWRTSGGNIFGIIANESEPFCGDCDRLRLDSQGNIFGCLSSNTPISIKEVSDAEILQSKLQLAMSQKQEVKFTGSELSMLEIGG